MADETELRLVIRAQIEQAKEQLDAIGRSAEKMAAELKGSGELSSEALDGVKHSAEELKVMMDTMRDVTKIKVEAQTAKAEADLEAFKAMLDTLPRDKRVRIDFEKRTISMGEVNAPGGGGGGGMGFLGGLIASLIPIASPLLASVLGGAMGLASAFTSAGVAAAGFGAVAIPNIKTVITASQNLTKAQEQYKQAVESAAQSHRTAVMSVTAAQNQLLAAQQQYNAATTNQGRSAAYQQVVAAENNLAHAKKGVASSSKAEQAALKKEKEALSGLSASQLRAVSALRSFGSFWKSFTASFQTPVLNLFADGLSALQKLLTDLKPAISAAATAFGTLMQQFSNSLNGAQAKSFFNFLAKTAVPNLVTLGQSFGNVFAGIMNLMVAFGPLGVKMSGGLEKMTQRFQDWTAKLGQSKGFKQFIQYVQTNGPKLLSTIGSLSKTIGNLLVTLAPFGAQVLSVVKSISSLLVTVSQWIESFSSAHPAIANLLLDFAGIDVGLSLLGKKFKLAQKAADLLNLPFKKLGDAASKLGANLAKNLGAQLTKLSKSAGTALLNNLQKLGTGLLGVGKQALRAALNIGRQTIAFVAQKAAMLAAATAQKVLAAAQWLLNAAMDANPIGLIVLAIAGLIAGIVLLVTHWKTVIHWLQEAWNWFKHLGLGVQAAIAVIFPFIGIPALIVAHWGKIKEFFNHLWQGVKHVFHTMLVGISHIVRDIWHGIVWYFQTFYIKPVEWIAKMVGHIIHWFSTLPGRVVHWVENMWSRLTSSVKHGAADVRHGVADLIKDIFHFFGGLPGQALQWGKNMIGGFINGIKNMAGAVSKAAHGVISHVAGFLGFHSPAKEGPGKHIVEWGRNMIKGFIDGINTATPQLRATMNHVLTPPKYGATGTSNRLVELGVSTARNLGQEGAAGRPITVTNHITVHAHGLSDPKHMDQLAQKLALWQQQKLHSVGATL